MSAASSTCGCCTGLPALTPESNLPGQPALVYRIATYATFLQRMLSQIASPNTLANPPAGPWTIANLTTRSDDDPTIALLDAWSVVLDVLTFYQERIANEGFLRTSTEHRSVLELARAIGYELNPGVSAGTYLSFIIEDVIGSPSVAPLPQAPKTPSAPTQGASTYNAGIVTLVPGTQVQSVPPQGQISQTFETSATLNARTDWNLMLPRITRPADFAIGSDGNLYLLGVRGSFPPGSATVELDVTDVYLINPDTPSLGAGPTVTAIQVEQIYFSGTNTGIAVGDILLIVGTNSAAQESYLTWQVRNVVVDNTRSQTRIDFSDNPPPMPFAPAQFSTLVVPSTPVPFSRANVETYVLGVSADESSLEALIQISGWDPEILATVANYVPEPNVSTQGVFAFATETQFFGNNAPSWKTLSKPGTVLRGDAFPLNWDAANNGQGTLIFTDSQGVFYRDATVFLERNVSGILSNGWMLVESPGASLIPYRVNSAIDKSLADYGLSGKSTGLTIESATGQKIQSPSPPALIVAWFGSIYLFASNSDGNVYFQTGIAHNWEGFSELMEGSFSQTPCVIATPSGDFAMFAVGDNGGLYQASGFGGLFSQLAPVNPPFPPHLTLIGTPGAVTNAPNTFDVFAHGTDGNLYHFWQFNNQWHGPELHQAPSNIQLLNSPGVVGQGPSTTEIFSVGSDGKLYHTGWTLATGWWGPLLVQNTTPTPVITYPALLQGSPAAATGGLNSLDVFAIGVDGNLYHAWYEKNASNVLQWNGMENRGGNGFVGSPSLVIHGPSNLEVFMIGTDGNLYHTNWIGGSWFGPSSLGGGNLVGSPSATAPTSATIEVAAMGSDGNFYHFWFNGSWNGPELVPAGYVPSVFTRKSKAHVQSQRQEFVELPVVDDVVAGTTVLMLNGLVTGLTPGQAVAISGVRSDSPNQAVSEVVLLEDIVHVGGFTQLEFEPPGLQYSYARSSMTLNANTVAATNGATIAVPEVLGSGSASQINQSFTPKRSPITYVPAATASGAQSTLKVQVNDLIWQQEPSLYGLSPTDRAYIARQNDDGSTTITFGDGVTGALLPTGQNNLTATYRVGLGTTGNLPAGSISVLQSRPPGLRSVSNPVPSTGGADPETLAGARGNAPRTVLTIDRIVSIADYQNFAAAFAGIGKAQAIALVLGTASFIQITVAGVEGAAIPPTSQLLLSLGAAIDAARDPLPQVYISTYQPILFNITATIVIDETDYVEAAVHAQVVSAITNWFSFDQRSFAQPVTAAEIVAVMQAIPGVVAVDLTQLYRDDDPSGPSQTSPQTYLPARYAQVSGGVIAAAELLLLNPVGFSLTDQAQ
jgi:hypothetical protein